MNSDNETQMIKDIISYSKKKPNLIKSYLVSLKGDSWNSINTNNFNTTTTEIKIYDYYTNDDEVENANYRDTTKISSFFKHPKLLHLFRIGLTIVEFMINSTIGKDYSIKNIAKKGMIKLFEFDEVSNNKLLNKSVTEFLEKNTEGCIDIFSIIKINGHNTQIAYNEKLEAWFIGFKNYSCLLKKTSDMEKGKLEILGHVNRMISEILINISNYWLETLDSLKMDNKLEEFINDSKGLTLVGEYVGLRNLIKHRKNCIIFSSIVNNTSYDICYTTFQSNTFLMKYDLFSAPAEKVASKLKNYADVLTHVNDLYLRISSDYAAYKEEGAIIHIVGKVENCEDKVLSAFKILNNEMKFFRQLYKSLKKIIPFVEGTNTNNNSMISDGSLSPCSSPTSNLRRSSNKFILNLEPIMLLKMPMDKKFYFSVANTAFDYATQEMKLNGSISKSKTHSPKSSSGTNSVYRDMIANSLKEVAKKSGVRHPILDSDLKIADLKNNFMLHENSEDNLSLNVGSFTSEVENFGSHIKSSTPMYSKQLPGSTPGKYFQSSYNTENSRTPVQIIDCVMPMSSATVNNFVEKGVYTMEQEIINKRKLLEEEEDSNTFVSKFNPAFTSKKESSKFSKHKMSNSEKDIIQIQVCKPKPPSLSEISDDSCSENSKFPTKTGNTGSMVNNVNNIGNLNLNNNPKNSNNVNLLVQNPYVNLFKKEDKIQVNNNYIFVNSNRSLKSVLSTIKNIEGESEEEGKNKDAKEKEKEKELLNSSVNTPVSPTRVDRRGYNILKGGKKHRVTFADQIKSKSSLLEIVNIQSYKKYNIDNTFDTTSKGSRASIACCSIF